LNSFQLSVAAGFPLLGAALEFHCPSISGSAAPVDLFEPGQLLADLYPISNSDSRVLQDQAPQNAAVAVPLQVLVLRYSSRH